MRFFLILLAVFFSVSGIAQVKTLDQQTLFSIGDRKVSAGEFMFVYRKNSANRKDEFTEAKIDDYLNLFVNFKLKVEEARHRQIDSTKSFINEFKTYKIELLKPYLPESRIVDSMAEIAYQRMKEEVKASHILISVEADAPPADTIKAYQQIMALKARALAGEDFANLAAAYSNDPSAATNRGELGYFSAFQMVYQFEDAAYRSKPGDITGPFRTSFGYHLLKLEDRRPSYGEVEVSHIMIRTGQGHNSEQAKAIIDSVYTQLKNGVPWTVLCQRYSEDPGSKVNDGLLRPFGSRALLTLPQFEVAFHLKEKGDLSQPIETDYGWHILRLERKIVLPPYEEISENVKARVAQDDRTKLFMEKTMQRLEAKYNFKENESVRNSVFSKADSITRNPSFMFPDPKEVLFTVNESPVAVSDFVNFVHQQNGNSKTTGDEMNQYYEEFKREKLTDALEEEVILREPSFRYLLNEYYEGILLFDIMDKEVWSLASNDSLGQRHFFELHHEKYDQPQKVKATVYPVKNVKDSQRLKEMLSAADSTGILQYLTETGGKVEGGRFLKGENGIVDKSPKSPGIHDITQKGKVYLVAIEDVEPARSRSFEETGTQLITDYQDSIEQGWIQKLKDSYPVRINEKTKKAVIKALL